MTQRCRVLFLKTKGMVSWLYRIKKQSPWDDVAFEYQDNVYWIDRTGYLTMVGIHEFFELHRVEFQPATQVVQYPSGLIAYLNTRRAKQGQRPTGRFDWTQKNVSMVFDVLNIASPKKYGEDVPNSIVTLWERLPNLAYITQT